MSCKKCETKPYEGSLCKSCFQESIEKRFRKEIRESSIEKGDKIFVEETGDTNYFVLKDLLAQLKYLVELSESKESSKTFIPWSADKEISDFLDRFSKKDFEKNKTTRLLTSLTQEEIEAYAKLKDLQIKETKTENKKQELIQKEIQKLDEKYKGIKKGTIKSIVDLEKYLS